MEARQYYRNHAGVRRRGKGVGSTNTAARRALTRNVDAALRAGGGGFKSTTPLKDAIAEWLRSIDVLVERGARSPTTADQYRRNAEVHVIPAIGDLKLSELSTGRLDTFLTNLHERKGYATAKISRSVLSGTCSLLMRRDALRTNPIRDVGRLEQGDKKAARALSTGDARRLLALLDAHEYGRRKDLPDLIRFLLATGVRLGEALGVSWADVDLDGGLVVVEWTVVRVKGKGLIRKSTKSAASERTLALPAWCVEMLRRRKVEQDALARARSKGVALGISPAAPVFPDARGGWRDRSNVGRDIRMVRNGSPEAATGFEWVTSHTARRSVATVLDGMGLSARTIADQLGHARPSMTQDVYMGRRSVGTAAAEHLQAIGEPENSSGDVELEPDE